MLTLRVILTLLAIFIFHFSSFSQSEASSPSRPKVGLVLSGGGAKGFSHIGVLKVLEEAGIRPDYITGTSMGSIVGGLYALGYPADSLEALAIRQDWDQVLTDVLSLPEVIYEEKLFFKNQLFEVPLVGGKLKAPSGLIQGQEIEHLLEQFTLPAYGIHDFNQLPIPFHCMAVDLYQGIPIELDSGSLAQAIRASMSIPSAFAPVHIDSLILIDGGVIRNFPVQEARAMGADIIIGVHCGPRMVKREELQDLSGIIPQALFLGSVQDSEEQMEWVDLYIESDIEPYGAADFKYVDTLIARGEASARAKFQEIKRLADSLNALGPPPPPVNFEYPQTIRIDSIVVTGNQMFSAEEIIGRSELKAGSTVQTHQLDEAINTLFGTNYFNKITYRLDRIDDRNVLVFLCNEKPSILIKGSLIYDSYHEAGIAFNFTLRNLLLPASRFMFVGRLANNFRYRFSYLKYLGKEQQWFLEALFQINRDAVPSIQEGRTREEYRLDDAPFDLRVFRRLGNNATLGIGGQYEWLTLKPTVSADPDFTRLLYHNLNAILSFQSNTYDRNILPTRGTFLQAELKLVTNLNYQVNTQDSLINELDSLLFDFDPYPKLTIYANSIIPLGQRSGLKLSPYLGIVWNSRNAFSDFFLLGSPEMLSRRSIPFQGLDANEFAAQVAIGTGLGYQYFLNDNLAVALDLSAGFFAEPTLLADGVPNPNTFLAGGGLSVGYNSIVGPIKFNAMYPFTTADETIKSQFKFFLTFGHRF